MAARAAFRGIPECVVPYPSLHLLQLVQGELAWDNWGLQTEVPKKLLTFILGLFFVLAGMNHFRVPSAYAAMVPAWLPWPTGLSVMAGIGEIVGGVGILLPEFRRAAGWGLVALLVAVFPANLHAAIMGHVEGFSYTPEMLWIRLPLQALLVAWVAWVAIVRERAVVI